MIDTFIALFGGLFLLGKKANKKLLQADIDRRSDEYYSVHNMIKNDDLQYSTLMPQFIKEPWQCLDTISDGLEEVFGKEWRTLFHNRRPRDEHLGFMTDLNGFTDIWGAAYEIYLSYYGQVCTHSYNVRMIMRGAEPDGSENMQKSRECNLKTCRVIERNMQAKYGADMRLWSLNYDPDKLAWEHYADKLRLSKKSCSW